MSQTTGTRAKNPISSAQALRQRRGGVSPEISDRNREHTRIRQKIVGALKSGDKTVPEIEAATGLPAHQVLWHLMASKKYGKIVERELAGDYYRYGLPDEVKR